MSRGVLLYFFFSSRRRHTRFDCDWSSDVCSSDLFDVTGGDNGLQGLTVPDALSDYTTGYYFVAAIVLACLLLMFILVRSPFGAALAAIRENRERAASVGINVKAYELAVFTIASLFAGVAGGL